MSTRNELPRYSGEYQWFAKIDQAVHDFDLLRLDSGWSGRAFMDSAPELRGQCVTDADHNVIIGEDLLKAVREAAKGTSKVGKLHTAYDATLRMTHASVLLTAPDRNYRPDRGCDPNGAAAEALGAGLAQRWARKNLEAVVRAGNLDLASPRLISNRVNDPFPHTTTAAKVLVNEVAGHVGRSPDGVLRELIAVDPGQRFNQVAEWMMKKHSLQAALPPEQFQAMRAELAAKTHQEFGSLDRAAAEVQQHMRGRGGADGLDLRAALVRVGARAARRGSLVQVVELWGTSINRPGPEAQTSGQRGAPAQNGRADDPGRAAFAGQAPAAGAPGHRPPTGPSSGQPVPAVPAQPRQADGGRRALGADPQTR